MRRHLFTLCSTISLLVLVATCVLWRRSEATFDRLYWYRGWRLVTVVSVDGRLAVETQNADEADFWARDWEFISAPADRVRYRLGPYRWQVAGLGYGSGSRSVIGKPVAVRLYAAPYWFVSLLSAVPPALWVQRALQRRRRNRRERLGHCPHCGYDLRASPGRCPECGAAAASAAAEPR